MNTSSPLPVDQINKLLIDTTPYLSCDECFARLDTYVERLHANPHDLDAALQVHLAACSPCAEEAATLMELLEDDDR